MIISILLGTLSSKTKYKGLFLRVRSFRLICITFDRSQFQTFVVKLGLTSERLPASRRLDMKFMLNTQVQSLGACNSSSDCRDECQDVAMSISHRSDVTNNIQVKFIDMFFGRVIWILQHWLDFLERDYKISCGKNYMYNEKHVTQLNPINLQMFSIYCT